MSVAVDLNSPLDLEDPGTNAFLSGIQANMLKGHARAYGYYLFIRFGASDAVCDEVLRSRRQWLSDLAQSVVTSAEEQREQTWKWKHDRISQASGDASRVGTIGLSAQGYLALGFKPEEMPKDDEFRSGLHASRSATVSEYRRPTPWDPDLDSWEPFFKPRPSTGKKVESSIHVFVHLAHDDSLFLQCWADRIRSQAEEVGCEVESITGKRQIHRFLRPNELIEHFGFAEGISSPSFIRQDAAQHRNWPRGDEAIPLNLLLVQEPSLFGLGHEKTTYGSYGAFMKLEQDVAGFRESSRALGKALGICPASAAALAAGRRQDGTPLVGQAGNDQDDFDYRGQDADMQCPHHAHVRRMNVRRDSPFSLVRRGMSYGDERVDLHPGSELPIPTPVGLLFLSFQASVRRFSSRMFAALEPKQGGADAILGRNSALASERQFWPTPDGKHVQHRMANFVIPRGGEYFFFPSLWFFENLPNVK